jgi:hypothetical protein
MIKKVIQKEELKVRKGSEKEMIKLKMEGHSNEVIASLLGKPNIQVN